MDEKTAIDHLSTPAINRRNPHQVPGEIHLHRAQRHQQSVTAGLLAVAEHQPNGSLAPDDSGSTFRGVGFGWTGKNLDCLEFFPFPFSFSSFASNVWIQVSIGGSPQLRSCPGRACLSQRFYWPTQCCPTVLTIDLASSLRKDLGMGFTAEVTELLNCN